MDVYKMSWREFQLRSYGYSRAEKNDWIKVREIAYNALIGSHLNPKTLPKSKEKYLNLEGGNFNKKKVSDEQRAKFLELTKKWINERKVKFPNRSGHIGTSESTQ
jgi:hypothetical protein